MELSYDALEQQFQIALKGEQSRRVSLGTDARGNLTRLDNAIANIPRQLEQGRERLENLRSQQEAAQAELARPFPQGAELREKSARLAELNAELDLEEGPRAKDAEQETLSPARSKTPGQNKFVRLGVE